MSEFHDHLADFISRRFNGGRAVRSDDSLMYSGMVDSMGMLDLTDKIGELAGCRLDPTVIVEEDLDSIDAIVRWLESQGLA